MKKTLLCLLLLTAGILNAQNINIPDANFKNYLLNEVNKPYILDLNKDGELQVTEALAVTHLMIYESTDAPFTNLIGLEAFKNLEVLDVITNMTNLNISGLPNLYFLGVMGSNVSSFNLSELPGLKFVAFQMLKTTTLDFSSLHTLESLHLNEANSLKSIIIGDNPQLETIYIDSDSLTSLDLSAYPKIESVVLSFGNTTEDVFVNLKNGNPNFDQNSSGIVLNESSLPTNKCYVCIDEGEEVIFGNLLDNVLLSTYCTFTPGGSYNTIEGIVTLDADNNGCGSNDLPIPLTKVSINDAITTGASFNLNGNYSFYTQAGTYILTPQFENGWFTAVPATITFATVNNSVTKQNFCVTANGVHNDTEVVIVPISAARPGFDATYKIIYKNKGNQTLSGNVTFTYNDDVLDYISASAEASSSATGSLVWDYTSLKPFESREINLQFNVNGPTETPAVNIDDVLAFTAVITPSENDETPTDNTFNYNPVVVGSFDPNDITCLEGYTVNPNMIGKYLHYNINFENTGTAPATFIVVKNVIDANQFDVNSLQILNASHAIQTRVTGNKVEFIFDDINLAGAGKGNVTFKIKSLGTVPVNSKVSQNANIYFDYNFPVATNNAETVFGVLSTGNFTTDNSVSVYPNPSNGMVNIKANTAILSLQLYDVQGRLLQAGKGDVIDISGRSAGLYFLKIQTEKGIKVEKIIKK